MHTLTELELFDIIKIEKSTNKYFEKLFYKKMKTENSARQSMEMTKNYQKFRETANEIAEDLRDDPNNLGLFIFGSVATRTATSDSDLDLVLVALKPLEENEPKNVKNFIKNNIAVQLSIVSVKQIKEDIDNFIDYRILQLKQGIIVFDKKRVLTNFQTEAHEVVPSRKVIEEWSNDLREDRESLSQPQDLDIFKLNVNRAALWALRIYLANKGDIYEGGKTLERQLARNPEISDLFIQASGLDKINLQARELKIKEMLSRQKADSENPYFRCAIDKLKDCEELADRGEQTSANLMLSDAIMYYGLYLMENKQYSDIDECIRQEEEFKKLISIAFQYQEQNPIYNNYRVLNNFVTSSIS